MSATAPRAVATRKGKETRRRILDAALELFKTKGFGQTTMRDIAAAAGLATGAAYYYFDSKDKLVLGFYEEAHENIQRRSRELLGHPGPLRDRLAGLVEIHIAELRPHRRFVRELFRIAADPESAVSPFGEGTRHIREESRRLFAEALSGSTLRLSRDLSQRLPRLIWLYHMGIILFWIHDPTLGQARTTRLVERTLDWIVTALKLSRLPVVAPLRKGIVRVLDDVEGSVAAEEGERKGEGDAGT